MGLSINNLLITYPGRDIITPETDKFPVSFFYLAFCHTTLRKDEAHYE